MIVDHPGFVLWFTGLSGAGKTTIAKAMLPILQARGIRIERLDGDVVRESLTKDLGFTKKDRDTNIERVTFVAKLLSRNNVAVLATFMSPYEGTRNTVRDEVTNYIEVFVDAPVEVCEERDVKGIYAKFRAGEVKNLNGLDLPYEDPQQPDIHVETHKESVEESAAKVIQWLEEHQWIPAPVTS